MPENRRILEWISLKDAPNGVIPNSDEIFAVLQEIQKLQECTGVARGRPQELRNIEWLIIDPVEYPSAALKAQTPVMWKEGSCEYQGQTARRFAYFIKFVNEEGERIYKEKVRYDPGGRTPLDIMSYFFGQLEDLGMIGYEPRHVEFVEIVHYVPENYVSEPLPTQPMECPPHNIADLEGDCDDL
ncbi:hypothetical protein N7527_004973 [Penicillium freii]|nr:hypothetical protein N7527_004973 [Penicillium freii]